MTRVNSVYLLDVVATISEDEGVTAGEAINAVAADLATGGGPADYTTAEILTGLRDWAARYPDEARHVIDQVVARSFEPDQEYDDKTIVGLVEALEFDWHELLVDRAMIPRVEPIRDLLTWARTAQ